MSGAGPMPGDVNAAVVAEDRVCLSCGYLLRGLPMSGVCPECGTAVAASLRGPYLRYEEAGYLRDLSEGIRLLALSTRVLVWTIFGGLAMGCVFAGVLQPGAPQPISTAGLVIKAVLLVAALLSPLVTLALWVWGVWRLTQPNSKGHTIFEGWVALLRWTSPAMMMPLTIFVAAFALGFRGAWPPAWLKLTVSSMAVAGFVAQMIAIRIALWRLHTRTGAFVPRDLKLHLGWKSTPLLVGVVMLVLLWGGYVLNIGVPGDGVGLVTVLWLLVMIALGSVIRPVAAAVAGEVAASRELVEREGGASGGGGQGVRP